MHFCTITTAPTTQEHPFFLLQQQQNTTINKKAPLVAPTRCHGLMTTIMVLLCHHQLLVLPTAPNLTPSGS
eukprot:7912907-Ditylum_brightwellii.AAC.1